MSEDSTAQQNIDPRFSLTDPCLTRQDWISWQLQDMLLSYLDIRHKAKLWTLQQTNTFFPEINHKHVYLILEQLNSINILVKFHNSCLKHDIMKGNNQDIKIKMIKQVKGETVGKHLMHSQNSSLIHSLSGTLNLTIECLYSAVSQWI